MPSMFFNGWLRNTIELDGPSIHPIRSILAEPWYGNARTDI
jgi:hypothetical protein